MRRRCSRSRAPHVAALTCAALRGVQQWIGWEATRNVTLGPECRVVSPPNVKALGYGTAQILYLRQPNDPTNPAHRHLCGCRRGRRRFWPAAAPPSDWLHWLHKCRLGCLQASHKTSAMLTWTAQHLPDGPATRLQLLAALRPGPNNRRCTGQLPCCTVS